MRKLISVTLVILIAFTVSAPRAAATGVGGTALTVAEMAGVVSLIAGSLGIVFSGAGDMHQACEAFVKGLDPNSAAYLALASAVAQGSTIYIAGTNAVSYLGGLVDTVESFFNPGSNVVVEGSGVNITNMGQIYNGSGVLPADDTSTARFDVTESPVVFTDSNGNEIGSWTVSLSNVTSGGNAAHPWARYYYTNVYITAGGDEHVHHSNNTLNYSSYGSPYVYFGVIDNRIMPIAVYYNSAGVLQHNALVSSADGPYYSLSVGVSGGGEMPIDVPVFQEAGAYSPDLVGGVWDKLAEDAAAQNGNVTIDTNVGTYQGGATGYVDGDPNGVIAAPQSPSLGGAGSTKTETDTSTGTQTQTQTQTGAQAVPQSQTANPAITDVQTQTTFNGAALTLADIFPFCIPFDVYWMLKGFAVGREAPQFDIDLVLPGWLNYTYTFDFSQFERYAQVVRTGELAVFVIGLAAATRKFIKW